eukprot:176314_1
MYYYGLLVLIVLIEVNFASQKYHYVHGASMTWFEAREYCQTTYHTELATIITQADFDTARAQIVAEAGSNDQSAWIGLTDLDVKTATTSIDLGYWYWLDGTPCGCDFQSNTACDATNSMWPYVQFTDESKHCAEMRTLHSELTTTSCEVKTNVLCNAYQYECLFVKEQHDTVKTWKGANDYCKETYGTELATVSKASLQNDARGLCTNYGDVCFIGLTDSVSEGSFKWIDGTPYGYTNWAPNQPDNYEGGENCVEMISTDGKWNDVCCDCSGYDTWLCNVGKSIQITSCDGWSHSSYSNSLRVQVHGVRGSTPIFPLNRVSVLPVNGISMTFDVGVDKFEDSGQPYGIDLIVDDPDGYCIKDVSVHFGTYTMEFGEEHFGNGLILSAKCDRSFVEIRGTVPLLPCFHQPLALYNNTPRGVNNVSVHTCNMQNAGIAFNDMSDSLYAVITGKKAYSNAYSSTEIMPLNHYVAGSLNVQYLGVLVAANVITSDFVGNGPNGIAFVSSTTLNLDQSGANTWCGTQFGTQLATITSSEMDEWAKDWCGNNACLIGFYQPQGNTGASEGWTWVDATHATDYDNWAPGEPNDHDGSVAEDCATIYSGGWIDIPCTETYTNWLCNIDIDDPPSDAHYIETHTILFDVYSPQAGVVIGVKIESVNYDDHTLYEANFEDLVLTTDETINSGGSSTYAYDNGRYIIIDLENHLTVSKYDKITISKTQLDTVELNIYFIYKEATSTGYQLPFIYETQPTDTDMPELNWFHANDACAAKYGTSLASIHSEPEQFLVNMHRETDDDRYWIGLNDVNKVKSEGNFSWIDASEKSYQNWNPDQPDNAGGVEDCVENVYGKWNDIVCSYNHASYICASPYWPTNTIRTFQFNTETNIADILAITVGNNGADSICIDRITLNDISATYLSTNWIGTDENAKIMSSIFKYPVCDITIMNIRYETDDSISDISQDNITGMSCANHNRMITTECSISQTYETTTTTSITISKTSVNSTEYSVADESVVTIGSATEHENVKEATFHAEFHIQYTRSMGITNGIAKHEVNAGLTVGGGRMESWGRRDENSWSQSTGTEITKANTSSYSKETSVTMEQSDTFAVECAAKVDVPPSHSIDYILRFRKAELVIFTYTDLKLTLCSAFLHPDKPEEPSDYLFIDNIPGYLYHQETESCSVDFEPASYLRNDITCAEEQQLAISTGATYMPLCNEADADIYDGCQCEIVDSRTLAVCYCVDQTGNIIKGQTQVVENGTAGAWKSVCTEQLKCNNSAVTSSSSWFNYLDRDPNTNPEHHDVDPNPGSHDPDTNPRPIVYYPHDPKPDKHFWSFDAIVTVFFVIGLTILWLTCYDKYQKGLFLFASKRRNGYAPVKYMDSDIEQTDIVSA